MQPGEPPGHRRQRVLLLLRDRRQRRRGVPRRRLTPEAPRGITAVTGIEVGHDTSPERPTGCTVILAREGAVGGVDVRGGSPGTRETSLLDPVNSMQRIHAVFLAGGSAFGLAVGDGVVRYLDERDIGYRAGTAIVPIVAGAILYDLALEDGAKLRPDAASGYAAAAAASEAVPAEGSVGAGAGATVGKMRGMHRAMRGGFGTASITLPDGLTVGAAVAVNAVGDVVDPATGRVVAGARTDDGNGLADIRRLLRSGAGAATTPRSGRPSDASARPGGPGDASARPGGPGDASAPRSGGPGTGAPPDDTIPPIGSNTTIGVVATNADLTKPQVTKVAQMAQDGLSRAIYPAHTTRDGDTVFALATGRWSGEPDVTLVGALAADVFAEAILRAVRLADALPGIPSVSELGR